MADASLRLDLEMSDAGLPSVTIDGRRVESAAALNALGLDLGDPGALMLYSEAANHLARGFAYRVIKDAEAYRAGYEARFAAEGPGAGWRQGAPRLRDFGRCDTAPIEAPRLDAGRVVAFVEDDYLGIPYRVAFPVAGPEAGAVSYAPLATTPVPGPA